MFKRAIVIVSFGTSHDQALNTGIVPIEQEVRTRFGGCKVARAFISSTIRNKLKSRDNVHIDSPAEAIERLLRSGYYNIILQPALVIPGKEYEALVGVVKEYQNISDIVDIVIGTPLLHSEADVKEFAVCVEKYISELDDSTAFVLMGHGTEHFANAIYHRLLNIIRKRSDQFFLTLIDGEPTFAEAVEEIREAGFKKALIRPMLITAGEHALVDMASDADDSLKSQFIRAGIECQCLLEGLGSCDVVQNIFIRHIQDLIADDVLIV